MENLDKNVVIIYSSYTFKEDLSEIRMEHTRKLVEIRQLLEKTFEGFRFFVTDTLEIAKRAYEQNRGSIRSIIIEGPLSFLSGKVEEGWYIKVGPDELTPELAVDLVRNA